jgi:hypothetical protein
MDHNVLDILPVVFYDLTRVHEVTPPNPHEGFRRADLSVLTADDLRRLTQGRGALRGKFLDGIKNLLPVLPHDHCERPPVPGKRPPCHAGLKKWWNSQLGAVAGPSVPDPIGWLREQVTLCDDIPHDEVCGGCTRVVKKYLQTVREDLWTSLPDFFGLVSVPNPFPRSLFTLHIRRDYSPQTGGKNPNQSYGSDITVSRGSATSVSGGRVSRVHLFDENLAVVPVYFKVSDDYTCLHLAISS